MPLAQELETDVHVESPADQQASSTDGQNPIGEFEEEQSVSTHMHSSCTCRRRVHAGVVCDDCRCWIGRVHVWGCVMWYGMVIENGFVDANFIHFLDLTRSS